MPTPAFLPKNIILDVALLLATRSQPVRASCRLLLPQRSGAACPPSTRPCSGWPTENTQCARSMSEKKPHVTAQWRHSTTAESDML